MPRSPRRGGSAPVSAASRPARRTIAPPPLPAPRAGGSGVNIASDGVRQWSFRQRGQERFQPVECIQRLPRCQPVRVDFGERPRNSIVPIAASCRCRSGAARRRTRAKRPVAPPTAQRPALFFQRRQQRRRAAHDGCRHAGQFRDMHAPGPSGRALGHLVQEHHAAPPLLHAHRMRPESRQPVRQFGKFMEMCGENGTTADAGMQRLQHGPGDGEAVHRGRAAADLVDHDQRARPGLVQDRRGLGHFDHEGRAPARQIVGRADPAEQAIDDADAALPRRAPAARPAPAPRPARSAAETSTFPPCWGRSAAARADPATDRSRWGRRPPGRRAPPPPPDAGRPGSGRPRHR